MPQDLRWCGGIPEGARGDLNCVTPILERILGYTVRGRQEMRTGVEHGTGAVCQIIGGFGSRVRGPPNVRTAREEWGGYPPPWTANLSPLPMA